MKYSRKSRTKKGSSKFLKRRRGLKKGNKLQKGFKKKVLKVIKMQAEEKGCVQPYQQAENTQLTIPYAGILPNYLSLARILCGRGHNQTGTNVNYYGINDSLAFTPQCIHLISYVSTLAVWPQQGTQEGQRVGNEYMLKTLGLRISLQNLNNYVDNNLHVDNSCGNDCPPDVVIVRWVPATKAGAVTFDTICTNTFVYNNPDFIQWHYGQYVDWVRQYQIRPQKVWRAKCQAVGSASMSISGGPAQTSIYYYNQHVSNTHVFNCDMHFKGMGKKMKVPDNNVIVPNTVPAFYSILNRSAGSFTASYYQYSKFYDS
nr:MAG: capsid protein [Cressdnaviricota sp.]